MQSVSTIGPSGVPPTSILRADRVRRRIAASDSVTLLLSELAFGTRPRDHAEAIHLATRARVADAAGART